MASAIRLGQHAAAGPAGRHGRMQRLGDASQFVVGRGVDHATAGMDDRQIGGRQHVGGLRHLVRRRHDRVRVAELLRLPDGDVRFHLAVHDRFGHVEVHDARPSFPAVADCGAAEFGDAIERDDRVAPLREVLDRADLVECLVSTAAVRIDDLRAAAARDREHAIAFCILDDEAGQQVRHAGPVAGHADTELAGQSRIGAGHVRGTGLVPRRDDLDAELVQVRVEAEVRAVDDAEYFLDTLCLEHARKHCSAAGFPHGPVSFPRQAPVVWPARYFPAL